MTVTVFTNPSNPQCEATEQELTRLGVRYVAVDLFLSSSPRTHHGAATSRTRSVSSRRISQPESHFDASCPAVSPIEAGGTGKQSGQTGRPAPR